MTPEGKVKKLVTTALKSRGIWYYFAAANGYGRSGIPDIIAVVRGVFVGIECKADRTKKPTDLQLACRDAIVAAGGQWYLIYDKESCDQVMKNIEGVKS